MLLRRAALLRSGGGGGALGGLVLLIGLGIGKAEQQIAGARSLGLDSGTAFRGGRSSLGWSGGRLLPLLGLQLLGHAFGEASNLVPRIIVQRHVALRGC